MKVKFKQLSENAVTPSYGNPGDAGLDLTATSINKTKDYIEYGTGLAIEIPEGWVGLIFPRSSITKRSLLLKNSVGVIDSSYRGEVMIRFHQLEDLSDWNSLTASYKIGDKIAQLVIMPVAYIEMVKVTELSETQRGTGGFGSTDNLQALKNVLAGKEAFPEANAKAREFLKNAEFPRTDKTIYINGFSA